MNYEKKKIFLHQFLRRLIHGWSTFIYFISITLLFIILTFSLWNYIDNLFEKKSYYFTFMWTIYTLLLTIWLFVKNIQLSHISMKLYDNEINSKNLNSDKNTLQKILLENKNILFVKEKRIKKMVDFWEFNENFKRDFLFATEFRKLSFFYVFILILSFLSFWILFYLPKHKQDISQIIPYIILFQFGWINFILLAYDLSQVIITRVNKNIFNFKPLY
ncbi:hypothetical protein [Mesomycoplasma lagogenitalium]|uniref:Uncharacterized protein n=1 Tax=Mesomycoplasma lagogenitalium TaxID=171286 RepID=A0ABY8LWX7_9BACT|nr:hypothetical protein [Mesomycoplasma lagogenitalium]WGI36761.1 hypothetical protein QEG99_00525 [Mesomycoplasma lagogenitalium]